MASIRSSLRCLSSTARSCQASVWSDFTNRSASLKILDQTVKLDLFQGIDPAQGPTSIENPTLKSGYYSPPLIDDTFKHAYEFLQHESEATYAEIAELRNQQEPDQKKIDTLLINAERNNPEVLYNSTFHSDKIDASQPVYRDFLQQKWKNYDLMITMQRLETLHVIPDTLPTLDAKAHVQVKFPHNVTHPEFQNWITPGTVLPAFGVSQPPTIKIQDFDNLTNSTNLYTVLIVNPDTPDLEKNSFKSTLHYGLANVPLNSTDNIISSEKLLQHEDSWTFSPYQPLTPQKNVPKQRACVWVFRQSGELQLGEVNQDKFDIRAFVDQNDLTPIGAHVWRQSFDRSVNDIRTLYGLPQGEVFRRVRGTQPMY